MIVDFKCKIRNTVYIPVNILSIRPTPLISIINIHFLECDAYDGCFL